MIQQGQAFLAQIRETVTDDEGNLVNITNGDSSFGQDEKGQWSVRIYTNSMAMGVPHRGLAFWEHYFSVIKA